MEDLPPGRLERERLLAHVTAHCHTRAMARRARRVAELGRSPSPFMPARTPSPIAIDLVRGT